MASAVGVLSRIRKMSAREVGLRTLQVVMQRRDALYHVLGWPPPSSAVVRNNMPAGRFFFDPADTPLIVAKICKLLPDEAAKTIDRASRICQHEFDLLGYPEVNYGAEIEWNRDAIHDRLAPATPWYRINLFDFARIGDPKVTWELNRHQHLVVLARAWWLTGDDRFVVEALGQWRSWIEQNPSPIGINWASSLEVAFRSMSWLWMRALLDRHPQFTPELDRQMTKSLALHGAHIRRYLSTYSSPNTHLLGEAVGLMFIALLCPEIKDALQWRDLSWQIVRNQIQRQVHPDGVHFEQSTYYHVYALDFFLHARILAARNGLDVPRDYDEALEKMLDALAALCASGNPPRFGDDDGGRVFDGQRNRAEHLADPLCTGAVTYERGDWKGIAGAFREETLWLLGPDSAEKYDSLPQIAPSFPDVFPSGGIYRLHDAKSEVVFDAGPHGTARGGHGHADALSLTWRVNGEEVFCDPGTYAYPPGLGRRVLRSTIAHNTLGIDGKDQAEEAGPFAWDHMPHSTVQSCVMERDFQCLCASHTGYQRLPEPVTHMRWLFHAGNGLYVVRDVASGHGIHDLRLSWHLGPQIGARLEAHDCVNLRSDANMSARICFAGNEHWSARLEPGFISPAYGVRQNTSVLQLVHSGAVPVEITSVLMASADTAAILRYDESSSFAGVSVYELECGEEATFFVFNDGRRRWNFKEWGSDANFFVLGVAGDVVQRMFVAAASYLSYGGQEMLNAIELKWLDWRTGAPARFSPMQSDAVEPTMARVFDQLIGNRQKMTGKVDA